MERRYPLSTKVHKEHKVYSPVPLKNEQKLFVVLVCLYILTWYLQLGSRWALLDSIRFEFLLGAFLSIAGIITLLSKNQKASPLTPPILLFFFVLLLYTVFSYDRAASWDTFYNRSIKFSMLSVFLAAFVRTPWALRLAIAAFLLAMLKITSEGFIGWITGSMVWENQGIPRLHGSTGLYHHPNSFSGLAVGCLPFIYYLFPVVKKWQKALLAALFIFSIIVILFTGSRTGYVATALLLLYFWAMRPGKNKIKFIAIVLLFLLVSIPFIPSDYVNRFESIYTMEQKEGSSLDARIQIIKDAIYIYGTHPLGVGVGAFPTVRKEIFNRTQDTHNLYLEILTNLSFLGIISFSFLILRILKVNKTIQGELNNYKDDPDALFLIALSKAIYSFVLARLFLGLFGMDTYEIYWWFAAGFTISLYRAKTQFDRQTIDPNKPLESRWERQRLTPKAHRIR